MCSRVSEVKRPDDRFLFFLGVGTIGHAPILSALLLVASPGKFCFQRAAFNISGCLSTSVMV